MQSRVVAETQNTGLILNRRLRDLHEVASQFADLELTPLQFCEAIIENRFVNLKTRQFFSDLPKHERHYWISSLYALLMPKGRRKRLAAYFTPPHLAHYVINVLIEAGLELGSHRILDPASGGAAFLVPLAERIAHDLRQCRQESELILRTIETTLTGIEIEPNLARLSHILLTDLLRREINDAGRNLRMSIKHTNTLKLQRPDCFFDAIIGNPPYGRVFRPSKNLLSRFEAVVSDGYVNLYALFIEQALRWVRPGGMVCLIVPMSFIGGPYFGALRKRILESAEVLRLDPIDKRGDVFLDVSYDVCVLLLRKNDGQKSSRPTTSSLFLTNKTPRMLGQLDLPARPSERPWALPDGILDDHLFKAGLATLDDYGYIVKTGYFVWNRERHRYRTDFKPRTTEVPLYWARNVQPNAVCEPYDSKSDSGRIGLVEIATDSTAIVSTDAIILQRTSNRHQKRRLIAGLIHQKKVPGNRGFVSENHTLLIIPAPDRPQGIPLKTLCRLLNSVAVDARFRRISGSVSVSTKILRQLPLPTVSAARSAFQLDLTDDEAAETAYTLSLQNSDL